MRPGLMPYYGLCVVGLLAATNPRSCAEPDPCGDLCVATPDKPKAPEDPRCVTDLSTNAYCQNDSCELCLRFVVHRLGDAGQACWTQGWNAECAKYAQYCTAYCGSR
jgi:hypothetical protein